MKTLIKCQVPKRLIYILALSKHFLQRNGEFKNVFLYISKSFLSTVRGAELFQFNFDYNLLDLIDRLTNFTNKLFIIAKKSCQRHLAGRPRYCLRKFGKYIIPAALAPS